MQTNTGSIVGNSS